jgi:hypothetical protein
VGLGIYLIVKGLGGPRSPRTSSHRGAGCRPRARLSRHVSEESMAGRITAPPSSAFLVSVERCSDIGAPPGIDD